MAAVKEHLLLSQRDKQVLLAEVPAADPRDSPAPPSVTLRLVVEQCCNHGAGPPDVDTMEDVTCRVPLGELGDCPAAADRAFREVVARIDNPALRPVVAAATALAVARVRARCGADRDELRGMEFPIRVMFIDDAGEDEEEECDDGESGSDMEFGFGEFDLSGARGLHGQRTVVGYEDDDDDDGCGAQFTVRPYRGALARGGGTSSSALLLSGFQARSDGPELTEQEELTSYDIQHIVRKALDDGGSVEEDEAYRRALAGGEPVSRASRAAMVDQALQSSK